VGGVGRGKTMLMDPVLRHAGPQAWASAPIFIASMRQVHAGLRNIRKRTDPLDAVAEQLAARVRRALSGRIFRLRHCRCHDPGGDCSTDCSARRVAGRHVEPSRRRICTKMACKRQRFLPAIDLITSHVDVVHLSGPVDYRLRQLEQAATYLDSALPDTDDKLEQRFAALAGGIRLLRWNRNVMENA